MPVMIKVYEFPVGTGIYRNEMNVINCKMRVPCRYRDIPVNYLLSKAILGSSL